MKIFFKLLLKSLGFGVIFALLTWIMDFDWHDTLLILLPTFGLLLTSFSRQTRHKELFILFLMVLLAVIYVLLIVSHSVLLEEIILQPLHNLIVVLTSYLNILLNMIGVSEFAPPSKLKEFFYGWTSLLWLYAMLVFKFFVKYLLVFVPNDSHVFLPNIAYKKYDSGWKVKKPWQFQRYLPFFFVTVSVLLLVLYKRPFYYHYVDQWLMKDWMLYTPSLLIPIFIQWYLWLGGEPDIFQLPRFSDKPLGDPQAFVSFADLWERYQRTFSSVWRKAGNTMPGTSKNTSIKKILHKQLDESLGLIIQTYPNPEVLSVVQHLIHDMAAKGKQVVVLSDYDSNSRYVHRDWDVFFQSSATAKQASKNAMMSVSLFIDKLSDQQNSEWVGKIGLILIPEGEQLFRRPYVWKLMAHVVRDHPAINDVTQLKSVVLAEPRNNFDTSIRNILTFYSSSNTTSRVWKEYRVPMPPRNQFWWTIWGADTQQAYLKGLSRNYAGSTIGPAVPLAQFAGQNGPESVHNWLVYDHSHPEVENAEMLQQSAGIERCQFDLEERSVWGLIPDLQNEPAILTTELIANGNPWRTLASISQATSRPALCNVVVKRHLLSDYLMDNEQTFALMTTSLLSPNFYDDSRQDVALQILRRIDIAGKLPLSKLADALVATRDREVSSDSNLFQQLYNLIEQSLGEHFAEKIQMHFEPHWFKEKSRLQFEKRAILSLTTGNLFSAHLDWLLEYKILAEDDALLNQIRKDHVQQLYWPGKVIAVEGKKYKVSSIDDKNHIIKVNHNEMVQTADYRCQKLFELKDVQGINVTKQEADALGNHFSCELVLGAYQITSAKIAQSTSSWLKDDAQIITLTEPLSRHYESKRMLCFKHLDTEGNSLLSIGGVMALSAWLNESINSIMPEVAPFFIAVAGGAEKIQFNSALVQTIMPQWSTQSDDAGLEAVPCLWIIEDSHTDMGIIQAIEENYWYLLNSCYRWLSWYFSDKNQSEYLRSNDDTDNSKKEWFAYGQPSIDASIDLNALYEFLQLYQTRFEAMELHNQAEPVNFLTDYKKNVATVCDFCACDMEKKKQHILSDGRISCAACVKVAVNDVSVVTDYYEKLIKPFFKHQFGVSNFENVMIELVDQHTISAKQGEAFIPTADFDERSVGLAVYGNHSVSEQQNNSHAIYIESGFSLEETLSTLVHELCHIWQFMNLDIAKMNADNGNLLIEGHAFFAELHFVKIQINKPHRGLNKKQLHRVANKQSQVMTSKSIYGKGYRQLQKSSNGQSPFDWLMGHYGGNT